MYLDVRAHSRHAETLRANTVALTVVVGSAFVAFITSDKTIDIGDVPACVLIVLTGVGGLAFSISYTELYQRNYRRAVTIRNGLDEKYFPDGSRSIRHHLDKAQLVHERSLEYRLGRRSIGTARRFWIGTPASVAIGGIVLMAVALS